VNLNKVFILGNVTRQPEVKALPSGQSVTNFGIATNRFYTDKTGEKKKDTEFHNVVAFGKLADTCSRYLNKGSLVLIEGRLRTRNWVNSSGIKQYRTEIITTNMQLGPKSAGGAISQTLEEGKSEEIPVIEENYTPPATEDTGVKEESPVIDEGDEEIDVSKIPF